MKKIYSDFTEGRLQNRYEFGWSDRICEAMANWCVNYFSKYQTVHAHAHKVLNHRVRDLENSQALLRNGNGIDPMIRVRELESTVRELEKRVTNGSCLRRAAFNQVRQSIVANTKRIDVQSSHAQDHEERLDKLEKGGSFDGFYYR